MNSNKNIEIPLLEEKNGGQVKHIHTYIRNRFVRVYEEVFILYNVVKYNYIRIGLHLIAVWHMFLLFT